MKRKIEAGVQSHQRDSNGGSPKTLWPRRISKQNKANNFRVYSPRRMQDVEEHVARIFRSTFSFIYPEIAAERTRGQPRLSTLREP